VLALPAHAEPVTLQYKFEPGTELIYKLTGSMKVTGEQMEGDMTMAGASRIFVVSADAQAGTVTLLTRTPLTIEMKGAQDGQEMDQKQEQSQISLATVLLSGAHPESDGTREGSMNEYSLSGLDPVLPAEAVEEGATWSWKSDTLSLMIPFPAAKESKLEKIEAMEDGALATIVSTAEVSDPRMKPHFQDFSARSTAVFDIDKGVVRTSELKLAFAQGPAMKADGEFGAELESVESVPADLAEKLQAVATSLGGALEKLEESDYEAALAAVEAIDPEGLDEATTKGLEQMKGRLSSLARMMAMSRQQEAPVDEATSMLRTAEDLEETNAKAAAEQYVKLADKFPEHDKTYTALLQAARLYEEELEDEDTASTLLGRATGLLQKRIDDAGEAADPGDYYRLGRTYERIGETEKALAAYQAIAEPKGASDDARILAERAKARIEKLKEKPRAEKEE
jgi:tetratricopeptide (TPR) repeat protein